MTCKHVTNRLNDLALAALDGPRRVEVEAHVAGCPACRAALDRERRLAAAIDREVAAHLAAEPSQEFAARLRLRLAQEPAPETASSSWASGLLRWPGGWTRGVALALAASMAIGAVWLARRRSSASPQPPLPSAARATPTPCCSGGVPTAETGAAPRAARAAVRTTARNTVSASARAAVRTPPLQQEALAEVIPQVIVDPHQQEDIARLYYAIQANRVDLVSFMAVPPGFKRQADGSLAAAPLEIEPAPDAARDTWSGEAEPAREMK
ncbi:MAG TPA: zf-HC2 domain-containing protein [Terriglobia bacterium]|nr:zf-HC2 domain-containing protein [Terriglobia bacterium]